MAKDFASDDASGAVIVPGDASKKVPTHVGFIVDGNRRWAREHGLTTLEGHRHAIDLLKKMAYFCRDRHIDFVSAYVFSTENWNRSKEEIGYLMDLFLWEFRHGMKKLVKDGFRIVFLGSRDRLSKKIIQAIETTEKDSASNDGTTLALCFNYGGREEIASACRKIVESGVSADKIDETMLTKNLYHAEVPDMDILVRTSGEMRLSNFMLWRAAYAELMWIDKRWPDMTENDLDDVLAEFARRHRRFGQ